ncbi:MAG: hypothetical protein KDD66_13510 [Bdellovibrionales bacterium]|nr:hypothetical protein [Bdellovibrionales bacterium]
MDLRTEKLADASLFALASIVGIILGHKGLGDPDIGWHLAGGLSIIDFGRVPDIDFLSAVNRPWWCYSWLAEVIFAAWFRAGGFFALQLLQTLIVVSSVWLVLLLVRGTKVTQRNIVAEAVSAGIAVFLIAPTWHLRPQLISIILFSCLLLMREREMLTLPRVLLLTILWSNIHVYWILVPAVVGLHRLLVQKRIVAALRDSGLCAAAALVSPYGFGQFRGLFEYAFQHHTANRLIKEFSSLANGSSFLFVVFILLAASALTQWKSIKEREPLDSIVLVLALSAAALMRLKFLPVLGAAAAPLLTRSIFAKIFSLNSQSMESKTSPLLVASAALAFCVVAIATLKLDPPLLPEQRDLLDAAAVLESQPHRTDEIYVVINDFNHGGWLELGFWLQRKDHSKASPFRAAVDGRTLVMGADRLIEYQQILINPDKVIETAAVWSAAAAILPSGSAVEIKLSSAGWHKLAAVHSLSIWCPPRSDDKELCSLPNSSLSPS